MKKQGMVLAILLCMAMLLSACSVMIPTRKEAPEEVTIPNPIVEMADAAALAAAGFFIDAPEGASNVSYSTIDGKVGQVNFQYNGHDYCYRTAGLSEENIHGIYGSFSAKVKNFAFTSVDYNAAAEIYTISDDAKGAFASWKMKDAQFTLYVESDADLDEIAALVCELTQAALTHYEPETPQEFTVAPEIERMQPIMDTIVLSVGVDNAAAWDPHDPDMYWETLTIMAANYGLQDERVRMENGRVTVPRLLMLEWAEAMSTMTGGLMELSADLKPMIYYRFEFDNYMSVPSDRGDSETRIEQVMTKSWTDEIEVKLGYYAPASSDERRGDMDFVLVPNLTRTEADQYMYSVASVS